MKKTIIIAALLLFVGAKISNSYAQVQRQGNTFVASAKKSANDTKTKFTWKDSKGNEYPIYVGKTGSCYVIRTSKKSGKEYKQYLGKDISNQVCKELGIEYKPANQK